MVSNKVYYCKAHTLSIVADGPVQCEKCKENMKEIGWMEDAKNEGTDAGGDRPADKAE